jgi:hypothetical protein
MPLQYIPDFQARNSGRWVVADLHVHSNYSGGSLTSPELLMLTGAQLFDAVAIADHHQVKGAIEGEQFAVLNPACPLVIPAQEISLGDHSHLLIIGCKEDWGNQNRNELLPKIRNQHQHGGVIIIAHPWTIPQNSWATDCLQDLLNAKMIDGVELFNSSILEFGEKAELNLRSAWENLILPNHLAVVGGSDFHYHRQGRQLGAGRTYLKVNTPGVSGIIEALRSRRAVAGLFSYKPFDLGFFGAGHRVIFGNEPWYGELKGLINRLQKWIGPGKADWGKWKLLQKLIAGGYYQYAWDLVEG